MIAAAQQCPGLLLTVNLYAFFRLTEFEHDLILASLHTLILSALLLPLLLSLVNRRDATTFFLKDLAEKK